MRCSSLLFGFLLASTTLVHAQSDAETAWDAITKDINQSGLITVSSGTTHYDDISDLLSAQNVVYHISWSHTANADKIQNSTDAGDAAKQADPSETVIKMDVTIPNLVAKGLHLKDEGYAYASLSMEGLHYEVTVDAPGQNNDFIFTGQSRGSNELINGYQPFYGEFMLSPSRPLGSVLDYVRPLLTQTKYEKFESQGFVSKQIGPDGNTLQTQELGPLTLENFENGKIDSYEVAFQKVKMAIADFAKAQMSKEPDQQELPQNLTYEIGKIRYEGYDLGAIWAAFDPNATPFVGKRTILKKATIDGATIDAGELFSLDMGPMHHENYTLVQPEDYLVPFIDKLIVEDKNPDDLPREEQKKFAKAAADLIRGFSIGLSEFGAMKAKAIVPEGPLQGQKIDIGFDRIRLADFDKDGIREFSLSGLSYAAPQAGALSLGRFAIEDLEFPSYSQIEKIIEMNLDDETPPPSENAKLAPEAMRILLEDLYFKDNQDQEVKAKEISAYFDREGLAIPAQISTKIEGLDIPKSLIKHPLASVLLTQLQLDSLKIDQDLGLSWDADTQSYRINPLSLKFANIAALNGKIGFGGIMRAYLDTPEMAQAAMGTATVLPSELTLKDLGGMDELINMAGGALGMGPDQVRSHAESQLQAILTAFTKPDFARSVTAEVAAFLNQPDSLHIALSPASGVPLAQILGVAATAPQSIPDILNIGVVANGH
ncbi:hypothetical protein [uncultured Cohaesibacter sp.]|uniref:hypothetical protein n=1 Tax=uncultured Cohaesibacter sp. TaxID=1002546 RepID=UPI00293044AF|nr:hypothetical protein [uncultured Cohaesibacter sp.]